MPSNIIEFIAPLLFIIYIAIAVYVLVLLTRFVRAVENIAENTKQ